MRPAGPPRSTCISLNAGITDDNAAFEASSRYGGRKLIRCGVPLTDPLRGKIFDSVSPPSDPGPETFLVFESHMVASKPNPHDRSLKVACLLVQRACQSLTAPPVASGLR